MRRPFTKKDKDQKGGMSSWSLRETVGETSLLFPYPIQSLNILFNLNLLTSILIIISFKNTYFLSYSLDYVSFSPVASLEGTGAPTPYQVFQKPISICSFTYKMPRILSQSSMLLSASLLCTSIVLSCVSTSPIFPSQSSNNSFFYFLYLSFPPISVPQLDSLYLFLNLAPIATPTLN